MTNKLTITLAVVLAILFVGCKQNLSITPVKQNIVEAVFSSGNIITEHQYIVTAQADGYLSESFFNEGDSVKEGEILFRIDNDALPAQLESAEANYKYAVSNTGYNSPILQQLLAQKKQMESKLTTDSLNYSRYQKLVNSGAVSRIDYEKVKVSYESAKQDLVYINNKISETENKLQLEVTNNKSNLSVQQSNSSFYKLKAYVDGLIFQIQKKQGELVKRGEPIAEIGSGKYIAKLLIAEEDINKLQIGQEVFIELNTEREKSHKATLSKVYPYFDTREQSFMAEATFDEYMDNLKSGTQLQANIKINEKANAMVIPVAYLLPGDSIINKNNEKVKIMVGIRNADWVEILSGASDSTTVVLPK